jgi:hypothetical protein
MTEINCNSWHARTYLWFGNYHSLPKTKGEYFRKLPYAMLKFFGFCLILLAMAGVAIYCIGSYFVGWHIVIAYLTSTLTDYWSHKRAGGKNYLNKTL